MQDDESAIRRTIAQYAHFCDDGRFDEFADLFAEDATFSVFSDSHEGRANVKAFIEQSQGDPEVRGKHVCFNTVLEIEGGAAKGWTDFLFVGKADNGFAVNVAGRYHDTFVKDLDRWRFRSRRIEFMGDGPSL